MVAAGGLHQIEEKHVKNENDLRDPHEANLKTLSEAVIDRLLDSLAPGSSLNTASLMKASLSNYTHLVEVSTPSGELMRFVVQRYSRIYGDRSQKARVEYNTLRFLTINDMPVPEPLYIDESGTVLGAPGIVSSFLEGVHIVSPQSRKNWATGLAETLAKLHSIPCGDREVEFLLNAESVVAPFLDTAEVPQQLMCHPDGAAVWDAIQSLKQSATRVPYGLVHTDLWTGNVLWHEGAITGIIDWEMAAYGDPAIDVAYCRMDMCQVGMDDAADHFLKAYESAMDRRIENLNLWELVSAAGSMPAPADWLPYWRALGDTCSTPDTIRTNHRRFMANALRRATM